MLWLQCSHLHLSDLGRPSLMGDLPHAFPCLGLSLSWSFCSESFVSLNWTQILTLPCRQQGWFLPGNSKKVLDLKHKNLFWMAMSCHPCGLMYELKRDCPYPCLWELTRGDLRLFVTRWNTKKSMKRSEESPCWTLKHQRTSLPKSLSKCKVG